MDRARGSLAAPLPAPSRIPPPVHPARSNRRQPGAVAGHAAPPIADTHRVRNQGGWPRPPVARPLPRQARPPSVRALPIAARAGAAACRGAPAPGHRPGGGPAPAPASCGSGGGSHRSAAAAGVRRRRPRRQGAERHGRSPGHRTQGRALPARHDGGVGAARPDRLRRGARRAGPPHQSTVPMASPIRRCARCTCPSTARSGSAVRCCC